MDNTVVPRPAALDYPFMRRWLAAREQAAIDYLCDGWRYALYDPEPELPTRRWRGWIFPVALPRRTSGSTSCT
ncbi:hypothetical protein [Brachybacterium massiliense]|uniref:hypothetical protein n=1 Tax=Brachybacterium massiliense TaxID=1755098 RepID=UPI00111D427A|nr:hypothetical protein [Brachybacterium massiliense]